MKLLKEREEVLKASLEVLRKGLVSGMSGNISMRVGELIVITPSQRYYED